MPRSNSRPTAWTSSASRWARYRRRGAYSPTSSAGSINSSGGLYTAPATQATATITATSGGYTATAGVQVFNRDPFTNTAGGSWATAANWQNSTIASGAGVAADFSTLALTSAPTVTLDGARTVGDLLFGDTNNSYGWTLNTGTGGPLTLEHDFRHAHDRRNEPVGDDRRDAGRHPGFTKTGAGKLTLSASNGYSGTTTINAGKLVATGGGWYTTRSIGGGSLRDQLRRSRPSSPSHTASASRITASPPRSTAVR